METGETFKVEVYTGRGIELSEQASEVVVPGVDGEIGFLAHHSEYVGNLGSGILQIVSPEHKQPKRMVVSQGFARFSNNTLQVVTDYVDSPETINTGAATREAEEIEKKLGDLSSFEPEYEIIDAKLQRLKAQVELVS